MFYKHLRQPRKRFIWLSVLKVKFMIIGLSAFGLCHQHILAGMLDKVIHLISWETVNQAPIVPFPSTAQ